MLEALYRLNPVVPTDGKFDITDDYPRNDVEEYRIGLENKTREHAIVVHAIFALDDEEDLAGVHAMFGRRVIPVRKSGQPNTPQCSLTLSKGYSNEFEYQLDVDEAATVKELVAKAQLPGQIVADAGAKTTLKELADYLTKQAALQAKQQKEATTKAEGIGDAQEKAKALGAAKSLAETEGAKQLRKLLADVIKVGLDTYIFDQFLKARVPTFLYFDQYYQMKGGGNLEKLKARQENPANLQPSDRPMLGLIELARLNYRSTYLSKAHARVSQQTSRCI